MVFCSRGRRPRVQKPCYQTKQELHIPLIQQENTFHSGLLSNKRSVSAWWYTVQSIVHCIPSPALEINWPCMWLSFLSFELQIAREQDAFIVARIYKIYTNIWIFCVFQFVFGLEFTEFMQNYGYFGFTISSWISSFNLVLARSNERNESHMAIS